MEHISITKFYIRGQTLLGEIPQADGHRNKLFFLFFPIFAWIPHSLLPNTIHVVLQIAQTSLQQLQNSLRQQACHVQEAVKVLQKRGYIFQTVEPSYFRYTFV